MTKSFKHRGLERFFSSGNKSGIQAKYSRRLEVQLQALHTAFSIEDMDIPGWRLHALSGKRQNLWSITVSKSWRVVIEFKDGHAYVVNYEDYH